MSSGPSGTVALLFTDIEGSTKLLRRLGENYAPVLGDHRRILRDAWVRWNGHEVGTEGDSFFVVFDRSSDALSAAAEGQRGLAAHPWPPDGEIRVRIGMHVGPVVRVGEDFVGLAVHEAARVGACGHGGQIVLTEVALAAAQVPDDLDVVDLGFHALKDFDTPIRLFQATPRGLPADFPPLRGVAPDAAPLPGYVSAFVGRSTDRSDLHQALSANRLVTVTGPPGVGKTRLAVEVAAQRAQADGVTTRFVDLTPASEGDVGPFVARTIGVAAAGDGPDAGLLRILGAAPSILVLDNCEHVADGAAALAATLVASCPPLRVLVTSREPLDIDGEHVLALRPLREAAELFVARATAVRPDVVLDPADPVVVEICAGLDGLPLAIELAAAQMRSMSPAEIAQGLDDRFSLLRRGRRDSHERHRTLAAAIDWSYRLLDEDEQRVLARLSVFAANFDREGVRAVADGSDAVAAVDRLVDRSLVEWRAEGDETRFRLLATVRDYAGARLRELGEEDEARAAHAVWYRTLVAETAYHVAVSARALALDRLEAIADDIRTALRWLAEHDIDDALRFAVDAAPLYTARLHPNEGTRDLLFVLDRAGGSDSALRADALHVLADTYRVITDFDRARACMEEALVIDPAAALRGFIPAVITYGQILAVQGDLEAARAAFEDGLTRSRASGNDVGAATALRELGNLAFEAGDVDKAESFVEEAFTTAGSDAWIIGPLMGDRGRIALARGDVARAREIGEETLLTVQRFGVERAIAATSRFLGQVATAEGRLADAVLLFAESARAARKTGDIGGVAHVAVALADLCSRTGRHEVALRLLAAADTVRQRIGMAVPGSEVRPIADMRARARDNGVDVDGDASSEELFDVIQVALELDRVAPEPRQ